MLHSNLVPPEPRSLDDHMDTVRDTDFGNDIKIFHHDSGDFEIVINVKNPGTPNAMASVMVLGQGIAIAMAFEPNEIQHLFHGLGKVGVALATPEAELIKQQLSA